MIQLPCLFTHWMFRAYLDLGPIPEKAPYHLVGLDFGIRSLIENKDYPRIQSALNPSFRNVLIETINLPEFDVQAPQQLPESLRTERWSILCDMLDNFSELDAKTQVRIIWLISKLCFYEHVLELIPDAAKPNGVYKTTEEASLAYLLAYSHYRLKIDDPSRFYSQDMFQSIAENAPPGIVKVDAHYQMVAQSVKDRGDVETASYWHQKHLESIEVSKDFLSDFEHGFVMSRYYRVGGFLPQLRQDTEGVVAEMTYAEEYARDLPRRNSIEEIAANEALYPVLESRIKEAIWLDDLDLAESRTQDLVSLSPFDARAWLHRGEVLFGLGRIDEALLAYQRAVWYAPPGREIAYYFIGQCWEEMGNYHSAFDAYLRVLEIDPFGISAVEDVARLSSQLGLSLPNKWAEECLETLKELSKELPQTHPEPYKVIPKPNKLSESHNSRCI